MSLTEREQEVLGRYHHWQTLLKTHGLEGKMPATLEEFQEIAGCDGKGGCVGDKCSGGDGKGCVADKCSAGGRKGHGEYIQSLVQEKHTAEQRR